MTLEKRRIEGDLLALQSELKDMEGDWKAAEDRANKAESEVISATLTSNL